MLQVGQQVGNYTIVGEIAQGTNANIYKATYRAPRSRVVALKILHTPFPGTEREANNVLYQEAQLLESLKHPHILAVVDYGLYEQYPYIVKEYATAGSLRDRLRRLRGKAMSYDEAIAILQQVVDGLAYAHEQCVVHCDLKPENILFQAHDLALIADFDIARVLKDVSASAPGLGGTPSYMAPEQFKGKVSCASDQYALACMAYEMLTGQRPFQGKDANELRHAHLHQDPTPPTLANAKLPLHVDQALLRALEREPERRFANVSAFMAALHPVGTGVVPDQWASQEKHSGQRLILHQRGTPKAEPGDAFFYEATVAASEEVTEAIVRHRARKATPTHETASGTSTKSSTPRTRATAAAGSAEKKTRSAGTGKKTANVASAPTTPKPEKATVTKKTTTSSAKKTTAAAKETAASKKSTEKKELKAPTKTVAKATRKKPVNAE